MNCIFHNRVWQGVILFRNCSGILLNDYIILYMIFLTLYMNIRMVLKIHPFDIKTLFQ